MGLLPKERRKSLFKYTQVVQTLLKVPKTKVYCVSWLSALPEPGRRGCHTGLRGPLITDPVACGDSEDRLTALAPTVNCEH